MYNLFLSTCYSLGDSVALEKQLHGHFATTPGKHYNKLPLLQRLGSVLEFLFPVLINLKLLKKVSIHPLPPNKD